MIELPGVREDGMPGRDVQRKLGTTRGSPRRSRTAKASRISRRAAKSRCACEWGGWGRLSVDGPGHLNLVGKLSRTQRFVTTDAASDRLSLGIGEDCLPSSVPTI